MSSSLNRWHALTRFIDAGDLPADNNPAENRSRPFTVGRKQFPYAGSWREGERAAALMSLIHPAKLKDHERCAKLRDFLERSPVQPTSQSDRLCPQHWRPVILTT
ncbi:IS66 family transposase [Sphaerotilus mobilis]|uniref:IS66 family transposase n=1 Tax=Sphaerotilus mobilis TaxID=47994 RepID=UPI00102C1398|nr:transposase [Sphaerotilus mobilis]